MDPQEPHRPLPYYPWYVLDYRASRTYRRLNYIERGIYRELLDECWLEGGIPADPKRLAELLDIPIGVMAEAWEKLKGQFPVELPSNDGFYVTNPRLESERTTQDQHRAASRRGGLISGKRRRESSQVIDEPTASKDMVPKALDHVAPSDKPPTPFEGPLNAPSTGVQPPLKQQSIAKQSREKKTPLTPLSGGGEEKLGDWVPAFVDAWREENGEAEMPGGRIGKYLKPLVLRQGIPAVLHAWRIFARSNKQQFGPGYFAEHFGDFRVPDKPAKPKLLPGYEEQPAWKWGF